MTNRRPDEFDPTPTEGDFDEPLSLDPLSPFQRRMIQQQELADFERVERLWNAHRQQLKDRIAESEPIEDGALTVDRSALYAAARVVIPTTQSQSNAFRLLSVNDALFLRVFRDQGLRSDADRARLAEIISLVIRETKRARRRRLEAMRFEQCWRVSQYFGDSLLINVQIFRIHLAAALHFAGYGEWRGCILQGLINLDHRAA